MQTRAVIILAGAFLVGCVAVQVTSETATRVPREKVFDQTMLDGGPDKLPVVFKRDMRFGLNMDIGVYLDGNCIAHIGGGEALTVYTGVGRHRFGVGTRCGGNAVVRNELEDNVSGNDRLIFRISPIADGWGFFGITESGY
jgi:hypothetical protein